MTHVVMLVTTGRYGVLGIAIASSAAHAVILFTAIGFHLSISRQKLPAEPPGMPIYPNAPSGGSSFG